MKALVRFCSLLVFFTLTSSLRAQSVPMCTADQLSLATDDENGSFTGMSHDGTLLVLRNLGTNACKIEAFPPIILSDAKGPLKVMFTTPGSKFMHPGPVMVPAIVAPNAEVTASLRWVSSPVFDPGVCFNVTSIAVRIGTGKQQVAYKAPICGSDATSVSAEKTRFVTDPVYSPAGPK